VDANHVGKHYCIAATHYFLYVEGIEQCAQHMVEALRTLRNRVRATTESCSKIQRYFKYSKKNRYAMCLMMQRHLGDGFLLPRRNEQSKQMPQKESDKCLNASLQMMQAFKIEPECTVAIDAEDYLLGDSIASLVHFPAPNRISLETSLFPSITKLLTYPRGQREKSIIEQS
jgi:hypothetical protein